jgi:hypothetical protein
VIRGVILHLLGDLPLRVDMDELPGPGDTTIVCFNILTVDGKRPSFVENRRSRFVFPLSTVRLLELPASEEEEPEVEEVALVPVPPPAPEMDEEPDEDLLERMRKV